MWQYTDGVHGPPPHSSPGEIRPSAGQLVSRVGENGHFLTRFLVLANSTVNTSRRTAANRSVFPEIIATSRQDDQSRSRERNQNPCRRDRSSRVSTDL